MEDESSIELEQGAEPLAKALADSTGSLIKYLRDTLVNSITLNLIFKGRL